MQAYSHGLWISVKWLVASHPHRQVCSGKVHSVRQKQQTLSLWVYFSTCKWAQTTERLEVPTQEREQLFPVCLYTIQSQGWHIEITRAETCVSRGSDSVRQCNCSLPHALKQRAAEGYSLRQCWIKYCHSCCYSVTWRFKLWCLEEIRMQMYFAYEYNDKSVQNYI